MFGQFRAFWAYRHFTISAIRGELKARFIRSKLGATWFILHPLAMAGIYALILSEVLGAKLGGIDNKAGYALYLLAGVAGWGLFSEILNRCVNIFIEYAATLKKMSFPRICLPIIVFGSAMLNHLLLLAAVVFIYVLYGHPPTIHWVAIPIGMAMVATLAFGLGIVLGVLNVFSRDIGQVVAVLINLWFWLTPIVYSMDMVNEDIGSIIKLNPMTTLIGVYQDILVFNKWPDWNSLISPLVLTLTLLILSITIFRRASADLVDVL